MKKISIIAFLMALIFSNINVNTYAEEDKSTFSGSIGGEVWYAAWSSESGLDDLGVVLDYDIKPSLIWGSRATFDYRRSESVVFSIALDYFTSKMEDEYCSRASDDSDRDHNIYELVKFGIQKSLGGAGYFHMDIMKATYNGTLTMNQENQIFGGENGSSWDMGSDWFKTDVVLLLGNGPVLPGIGYRYFSYNKPLAIIDFYGKEQEGNGTSFMDTVQADELISGQITDADLEGHLLLLGIWDGSWIDMETEHIYFVDFLFYIGSANVKSGSFQSNRNLAMGTECSLGLKYNFKLSRNTEVKTFIGLRYLKHLHSFAEKIGEDEKGVIWRGCYMDETWFGPFLGTTLCF